MSGAENWPFFGDVKGGIKNRGFFGVVSSAANFRAPERRSKNPTQSRAILERLKNATFLGELQAAKIFSVFRKGGSKRHKSGKPSERRPTARISDVKALGMSSK
jgi:hypothetical protein